MHYKLPRQRVAAKCLLILLVALVFGPVLCASPRQAQTR